MINSNFDTKGVIRNIRAGHCIACGCRVEKGYGYRVALAGKGVRIICPMHYTDNNLLDYHGNARQRNNSDIIGTTKHTGLASTTIGCEIETVQNNLTDTEYSELRTYLELYTMCQGENDSTVNIEFPTEKMQGLATISKVIQSIEKHGYISAVNDSACGAHIHCGVDNIDYLRNMYHTIFIPLSDYIVSLGSEKQIEYFGRDISGCWARPIDRNSYATTHTNIFNMQHRHTIEFRLPHIREYRQYIECCKFWRECVYTINSTDLLSDIDSNGNYIHPFNIRKAVASALGNKLVDIAKKYYK